MEALLVPLCAILVAIAIATLVAGKARALDRGADEPRPRTRRDPRWRSSRPVLVRAKRVRRRSDKPRIVIPRGAGRR
jgi:hypothetical protein